MHNAIISTVARKTKQTDNGDHAKTNCYLESFAMISNMTTPKNALE